MTRGLRRAACTIAAVLIASIGTGGIAGAQPAVDPVADEQSFLPTPLGDPFFDAPADFAATPLGTVLKTRGTSVPNLRTPVVSTQYLFHSTDSKDRPIVAATTLIAPTAPWGAGARPVVAFNPATDSLGNTCAPSYTLPRGTNSELPAVQALLDRNYAVLVTDYQGPRQAYSAGRVEGHTVLDSLRAVVNTPATGLTPRSPIGITGYSGGAIASGWAAQLAPSYAPELNIAGVALGGTPTDYTLLRQTLNGGIGSGLYLAATFGLSREYPELRQFSNDAGRRLAQAQKDLCADVLTYSGLLLINQSSLQNDPNAFDNPVTQRVIADNRMGALTPTAPTFVYHGQQDFLIPKLGAENLYDDWCRGGASVRLEEFPGDHTIGSTDGQPRAFAWLADRLGGTPAPTGCSSVGR